jgi:hypothetical protein
MAGEFDVTDPMGTDLLWDDIRKKTPARLGRVVPPIPMPAAPVPAQKRTLDDTPRDTLQEHGLAAPSANSADVRQTGYEAEKERLAGLRQAAQESAMDKLNKALTSQATISPSQGFAAALLAAIPTLGGLAFSKMIKNPEIPEGAYFPGMSAESFGKTFGVGGKAALAQGAAMGQQTSSDYVAGITKEQNDMIPLQLKAAEAEQRRADALANDEDRIVQAQLSREAQDAAREDSQAATQANIRLQYGLAAANRPDQRAEADQYLRNPEIARAYEKFVSGTATGQEIASLPSVLQVQGKQILQMTTSERGQDLREGRAEIPGFENRSGVPLNPKAVADVTNERMGIAKTKELLRQYIANPDSMTGQESAIQGAISGMLVNAQRIATNSGSAFSASEQELVKKALPAILAGDPIRWAKENALGRDQKALAATLSSLYEKTSDYALADSLGVFRKDLPDAYYPQELLAKFPRGGRSAPGQMPTQPQQGSMGMSPRLPGESVAAYKARVLR